MIMVYHLKDFGEHAVKFLLDGEPDAPKDLGTKPEFNVENYEEVALVNVPDDDLERAYYLTNNIDHSWFLNHECFPTDEVRERGGCRSTSIGDVLVLSDGRALLCASCGWREIPNTMKA